MRKQQAPTTSAEAPPCQVPEGCPRSQGGHKEIHPRAGDPPGQQGTCPFLETQKQVGAYELTTAIPMLRSVWALRTASPEELELKRMQVVWRTGATTSRLAALGRSLDVLNTTVLIGKVGLITGDTLAGWRRRPWT